MVKFEEIPSVKTGIFVRPGTEDGKSFYYLVNTAGKPCDENGNEIDSEGNPIVHLSEYERGFEEGKKVGREEMYAELKEKAQQKTKQPEQDPNKTETP